MTNDVELYDKIGRQFSHEKLLESYHHQRRMGVVLSYLNKVSEKKNGGKLILDCGCGDGVQSEIFSKNHNVIGVDLSITRVKRAKAKGLSVIIADLNTLPFKDDIFEITILSEVIEHVSSPKNILIEINRVLKSKGILILDTPSKSNLIDMVLHPIANIQPIRNILKKIKINRIREGNLYDKIVNWGLYIDLSHVYFYDMGSIKKIVNSSGFNIIEVQGAPCLRYDLPSIIKPKVFSFFDGVLQKLPIVRKYGAIQVFICIINNK